MSQFLFESKHGKVWRNPVTGGHSCESRDVNALAGELAEALDEANKQLAECRDVLRAVIEDCEDGYFSIADMSPSWKAIYNAAKKAMGEQ